MSNLSTLPKGDSAWLLRKAIERIIQQVSVLETNIGSSTTGNSANTQIIFNDNGTLRGDAGLTYNKTTDLLTVGAATITGDLTVDTNVLKVDTTNNRVGIGTASPTEALEVSNGGNIKIGGFDQCILGAGGGGAKMQFSNGANDLDLYGGSTGRVRLYTASTERYRIASDGVATWSNVGGVAGTAMTLNSTGLGVGTSSIVNAAAGRGNVTIGGSSSAILNLSIGATDTGYVIHDGTSIYLVNRIAAGSLIFSTNSTERFRIDSSGNVGIGVTPSAWQTGTPAVQLKYNSSIWSNSDNTIQINQNAYFDGSSWKYVNATSLQASNYFQYNGSHSWRTAPSGTAGNAITWTDAMTLTAAGELLVGTTSAGGVFDTKFFLSTNSGTNKWAVGPYGTATNFAIIPTPGTGGVYLSGTSATSWTAYSDERLKDIIEPITNALTKVGSLRSVIGKFKGDEANTRRPFLIAQDLQSALPEAVDASNPDRLGVAYTDVIPLLVAAIKELTARVQTLETR